MIGLPASDRNWRARCQAHFGVPPKTDLKQLARHGESVFGVLPITRMTRLLQELPAQKRLTDIAELADAGAGDVADDRGAVWFEFKGSSQQGRRARIWLKVQAVVTLICQRCLGEMQFVVDETVEFELFGSQASADAAQAIDEVDPEAPEPLVVEGLVDLMALVEDQLILAIPYVPKHGQCEPSKTSAGEPIEVVKRESPFKVLEGLKRDSK